MLKETYIDTYVILNRFLLNFGSSRNFCTY